MRASSCMTVVAGESPTRAVPGSWSLPGRHASAFTERSRSRSRAARTAHSSGHRLAGRRRVRGGRDPDLRRRELLLSLCAAARRPGRRRRRSEPAAPGRWAGAARSPCWSATAPRGCSPAASTGWSGQPSGSRAAVFDEPVDDRSADELGELARAFDRMRMRLAVWSMRGASSSPTPRTSCGHRSSLSAASSSCWTDEELDEATRRSSSRPWPGRSTG